jgi:hypothetical protein
MLLLATNRISAQYLLVLSHTDLPGTSSWNSMAGSTVLLTPQKRGGIPTAGVFEHPAAYSTTSRSAFQELSRNDPLSQKTRYHAVINPP